MYRLSENKQNQSWLTWFLRGVLFLGFLILVGRLGELQIIKGEYYRNLAEGNRVKKVKIEATRGKIIARGGEILSGKEFAHITGYTSETTQNELNKIDPKCPEKGPMKLGQIVGRGGLQEFYNCHLSGFDGEELFEVDSSGNEIRSLGKREPIAGSDLRTSIDYNLQLQAAKSMEGKTGAVVATDKNGRVLVLYSSPSYDPSEIVNALKDPELPLFNRAMGGVYHPGSVFKTLTSIAALEDGKVDRNFRYNDTGVVTVKSIYGDFSYTNWYLTQYGGVEGEIDLTAALARSTDTFFYKIGEFVGIDSLVDWSKKFGLTKLTDIDIPGEVLSLVPTPDWKTKTKNERWFLGNTYHFSIGQGDLALTPVGIHRANLVIANKGKLCDIKIADETKCIDLKIKKENIDLVEQGMIKACLPAGDGRSAGTGFTFFDFGSLNNGVEIACKTGTAETNEDGKNHAWFTVYNIEDRQKSPKEKILVTVMVEKSGEGSKVAGPIARDIFDEYFKNSQ